MASEVPTGRGRRPLTGIRHGGWLPINDLSKHDGGEGSRTKLEEKGCIELRPGAPELRPRVGSTLTGIAALDKSAAATRRKPIRSLTAVHEPDPVARAVGRHGLVVLAVVAGGADRCRGLRQPRLRRLVAREIDGEAMDFRGEFFRALFRPGLTGREPDAEDCKRKEQRRRT